MNLLVQSLRCHDKENEKLVVLSIPRMIRVKKKNLYRSKLLRFDLDLLIIVFFPQLQCHHRLQVTSLLL